MRSQSKHPWAHADASCQAIAGPFLTGCWENPGPPSQAPRGASPGVSAGVGRLMSVGRLGRQGRHCCRYAGLLGLLSQGVCPNPVL